MKHIMLIMLFIASLFGSDFLEPEVAFKSSIEKQGENVQFKVVLDKSIYLYDEFLKVYITKPEKIDITEELGIRDPKEYDGFKVHFEQITVDVPTSLIAKKIGENKAYELEFAFQGCSKAGLCYAPMSKTYKGETKGASKAAAMDSAPSNDFLEPEKAFISSATKTADGVEFKIKLDDTIYLYDEFIKVSITDPSKVDLTKELQIREPKEYDGFKVHFKELTINVPQSLIDSKIGAGKAYTLELGFQGCSKAGLCYAPMSKSIKVDGASAPAKASQPTTAKAEAPANETDAIAATLQGGSVVLVLATFFGFGLLLALTPCIFPMIPILSSIIVQQSKQHGGHMSASRGLFLSIVYVLAMSFAYTIAGVLAGMFGANLQAMLQDPVVIIVFAGIFVALAFSMFGYYEIGLPASWQTRLNKTSEEGSKKGGILGVAIMGFLSALIVGPCVAPPLAGALIYIGQTGDAILGGAALFVMSLGMGLPLLLVGLGAGKYMPKPGGWMEQVSKIFGIVMLAIALWMLERIISDAAFIYASAILLIGTGIYLKAFEHIIAKTITTIVFVYGILLFVGAVSGATNVLDPLENLKGGGTASIAKQDKFDWQYVKSVKELDELVKSSDKPVMVDFWATWCVSCKELDNITFKDPAVIKELSKYKLVKVDVTNNTEDDKALMKKFNLFGPPALIFYENGQEILKKRIVGYKAPAEFLEIVK